MFVACSESVTRAGLLAALPATYAVRTLASQPQGLDAAPRAALEYGLLASGVRHVVVCGHGGGRRDGGAPAPEASQAPVVARCRAMQALWLGEASHDVHACDFEGRATRCLGDADLAALFNRFDEFSA
jgi:hypothetical protein